MKTQLMVLAAALSIGLLSPGQTDAQRRWFAPNYAYGFGRGAYGYNAFGYGGYGGGGTPASFQTQAMAEMVRAKGEYNQATAAGMVDYEQARGQYIENQKQWTELYQMRQQIRQEQAAQKEQERRDRIAKRDSKPPAPAYTPPQLLNSQLDPSTGEIHWPEALQEDMFSAERKSLEDLFASRAHTGTTLELTEAITTEVKEMQSELRKHIRELPTQSYIEARKFLDGLASEGQSPLG